MKKTRFNGSACLWSRRDETMILLHAVVAALYAVAAWMRWPRKADPAPARVALWLVPLAVVLHAAAIAHSIFRPDGLDLSFANALSLVAGLCALVAWASGLLATLPRVGAVDIVAFADSPAGACV